MPGNNNFRFTPLTILSIKILNNLIYAKRGYFDTLKSIIDLLVNKIEKSSCFYFKDKSKNI